MTLKKDFENKQNLLR